VYGFIELKTHAKLDGGAPRGVASYLCPHRHRKCHPVTASIQDLSYFTSDKIIGRDAARVFNYITGYAEPSDIERMAVALTLQAHHRTSTADQPRATTSRV
jgi:polyphosphate kinase